MRGTPDADSIWTYSNSWMIIDSTACIVLGGVWGDTNIILDISDTSGKIGLTQARQAQPHPRYQQRQRRLGVRHCDEEHRHDRHDDEQHADAQPRTEARRQQDVPRHERRLREHQQHPCAHRHVEGHRPGIHPGQEPQQHEGARHPRLVPHDVHHFAVVGSWCRSKRRPRPAAGSR